MRGVNYRQLLANWDTVIDKLCEECTPHDVLGVVKRHLERSSEDARRSGLNFGNIDKAIELLTGVMSCIDPER